MHSLVTIRELIGWGLDDYGYRAKTLCPESVLRAKAAVAARAGYQQQDPILAEETNRLAPCLAPIQQREDLRREYAGLEWTLAVVDLRSLLAFQRRLVFDPAMPMNPLPQAGDWQGLIQLAFGGERSIDHSIVVDKDTPTSLQMNLRAANPDLQLLRSDNGSKNSLPLTLHGGSPFFEVARFRERWFLRDGYHRAFHLLQAGLHKMIAVVIEAQTLDELGAGGSYFFDEETLFSSRPPRVVDFLNEEVTACYERPRLFKTIRIQVEEFLEPCDEDEYARSVRSGVQQ